MEVVKTEFQSWIERRVESVRQKYTTYQCLIENGYGDVLSDEASPTQISCPLPGHGPDRRPSARYYPAGGRRHYDHVNCFKCKENLDSVNLYARLKGHKFMDALSALERKFHIKVPRKPEPSPIVESERRDSGYVSEKWSDIPTVLSILESKLLRLRRYCSMIDYVKFCRVLDAVQWDYERIRKATPEMAEILSKLMQKMNDYVALDVNFEAINDNDQ